MIYFLRHPEGAIKIGQSDRLFVRVQELRWVYGSGMVVLAVIDGTIRDERKLHNRFASLRLGGEWFEAGPELLDFIASEGVPWDGTSDQFKRRSKRKRP